MKLKTHWQTRPHWPNVSTEHYIILIEFTFTMSNRRYRVSDSEEEEETPGDVERLSCEDAQACFQRVFDELLELDHANAEHSSYEDSWKGLLTMIVQDRYNYHMLLKGIKQLRSELRQLQIEIHRAQHHSGAHASVLRNLKHLQKMHEWASSLMQTKLRTFQRISA